MGQLARHILHMTSRNLTLSLLCGTREQTGCAGWPELGISWHPQAVAIAEAGYRVIVPDMRGYGATDAPDAVEAYSMKCLAGDMVALLDHLQLPRAGKPCYALLCYLCPAACTSAACAAGYLNQRTSCVVPVLGRGSLGVVWLCDVDHYLGCVCSVRGP